MGHGIKPNGLTHAGKYKAVGMWHGKATLLIAVPLGNEVLVVEADFNHLNCEGGIHGNSR